MPATEAQVDTSAVVRMISASADFEPDGAPEGLIEWTFLTKSNALPMAGVFELRFVRNLTRDELDARAYDAALTPA